MGVNEDLRDSVAAAEFWWRSAWQADDPGVVETSPRSDGAIEKRRILPPERARLEAASKRVGRDPGAWAVVYARTKSLQYQRLRERIVDAYASALEKEGTVTVSEIARRPRVIRSTVEGMFARLPQLFHDAGMEGSHHLWMPIVARGPPPEKEIEAFTQRRWERLSDGEPASAFVSPRSSHLSEWLVLPEFLESLVRLRQAVRSRGGRGAKGTALVNLVSTDFGLLLDLHAVVEGPIMVAAIQRATQVSDAIRRAARPLTTTDLATSVALLHPFATYERNFLGLGATPIPLSKRETHEAFPDLEANERLDRVTLANERALGLFKNHEGAVRILGSADKAPWDGPRPPPTPDDAVALVLASFVERMPTGPEFYPRSLTADIDDVERVLRGLAVSPWLSTWLEGTPSAERALPWLHESPRAA